MFYLCVFQVSAWNKTPSSDTVSCPIVATLRCSWLQWVGTDLSLSSVIYSDTF